MKSFLLLIAPVLMAATDPAVWPKWRGPNETGVAKGSAPTEWDDTKNIAWKANIPGRGHSSPILWGDLVFITTLCRPLKLPLVPLAVNEAPVAAPLPVSSTSS